MQRRSLLLAAAMLVAASVDAQEPDLSHLSLEQLLNVKVTSASRIRETANLAPATVYVVTAAEIERLGLRDLKDILQLVPGVDTSDPHFFLLGGQRGFEGSFANTLLLINGREMNNLIAGETFISNQFRSGNIKQVEIINGPGSALYGANAIAGVINIITKTSEPFDGVQAFATAGSFRTAEEQLIAGNGPVRGSFSYYHSHGDNFASFLANPALASKLAENNGYRTLPGHDGYDNRAAAYTLSFAADAGPFYAGAEAYRNMTGRGTSGIQWDYLGGADHRDLKMEYAGWNGHALDDKLHVNAELRRYDEVFWGNHTEGEGPIINPETGAVVTSGATPSDIESWRGFYSNKRGDGSIKDVVATQADYEPSARQSLVGGVQFEHADVTGAKFSRTEGQHPAIGPDEKRPEFHSDRWGVFVQDQLKTAGDRVILTIGGRYDHQSLYGGSFNPRAGVVVRATDHTTLKLLYGEAFREPNPFELQNSNGIKPTKLRTWEVGWNQSFGASATNQVVFFRNRADDLIVTDLVGPGGISNKGELRARGAEDFLRLSRGRWTGFVSYTLTTADLDEPQRGKHRVYDIPRHKANAGLTVDLNERLRLGVVARHHDAVDTEYHGELFNVPSYTVYDATLTLLHVAKGVTVQLIARNLLDKTYYQPEPRAPSVVMHPQDGRDVSVRISFR